MGWTWRLSYKQTVLLKKQIWPWEWLLWALVKPEFESGKQRWLILMLANWQIFVVTSSSNSFWTCASPLWVPLQQLVQVRPLELEQLHLNAVPAERKGGWCQFYHSSSDSFPNMSRSSVRHTSSERNMNTKCHWIPTSSSVSQAASREEPSGTFNPIKIHHSFSIRMHWVGQKRSPCGQDSLLAAKALGCLGAKQLWRLVPWLWIDCWND